MAVGLHVFLLGQKIDPFYQLEQVEFLDGIRLTLQGVRIDPFNEWWFKSVQWTIISSMASNTYISIVDTFRPILQRF